MKWSVEYSQIVVKIKYKRFIRTFMGIIKVVNFANPNTDGMIGMATIENTVLSVLKPGAISLENRRNGNRKNENIKVEQIFTFHNNFTDAIKSYIKSNNYNNVEFNFLGYKLNLEKYQFFESLKQLGVDFKFFAFDDQKGYLKHSILNGYYLNEGVSISENIYDQFRSGINSLFPALASKYRRLEGTNLLIIASRTNIDINKEYETLVYGLAQSRRLKNGNKDFQFIRRLIDFFSSNIKPSKIEKLVRLSNEGKSNFDKIRTDSSIYEGNDFYFVEINKEDRGFKVPFYDYIHDKLEKDIAVIFSHTDRNDYIVYLSSSDPTININDFIKKLKVGLSIDELVGGGNRLRGSFRISDNHFLKFKNQFNDFLNQYRIDFRQNNNY
jgi:hypothetical protein